MTSDVDKQSLLDSLYGELLGVCAATISANNQLSFDMAGNACLDIMQRIALVKGLDAYNLIGQFGGTAASDAINSADSTSLLLTDDSDRRLLDVLKNELISSSRANLISAFITRGMTNLLVEPFLEFVGSGGGLRILTSVMNDFNNPDDLIHLQSVVPGLELRVYYPTAFGSTIDYEVPPPPFHVKCYLFEKHNGRNSIIIGSSNLTQSGMVTNREWNYYSSMEINAIFEGKQTAFDKGVAAFEKYWFHESTSLNDDFLSAYKMRWRQAEQTRHGKQLDGRRQTRHFLAPRTSQIEALTNLVNKRTSGVNKTVVIAATGLGKTHLAAFDFLQSHFKNLLFLAHRETILRKANETYRSVLGVDSFGQILSGASDSEDINLMTRSGSSLFAMVPSLVAGDKYRRFEPDHFEYMVVDEFHHSAAGSYQKLLDWFKPKFLLGLTATPERLDGRDVLANCDYDVAYEIRLFEAIDKQWLVPFQYFAIYDATDYTAVRWTGLGYDEIELDEALNNDTRASLIINNLAKFLPSTGKIKALAFCSSRAHARFMAKRFNEYGISAECLTGEDTNDTRTRAIENLQDENHPLQVICSVDILGEGVDLPAVSHVLLLRPTMSFTVLVQQIGRGLRKAPEKEFLVCLDFVGNFRNSFVTPLMLQGFNSPAEFKASKGLFNEFRPPNGCYISASTQVQKVWDEELRRVLKPSDRKDALRQLYYEMRASLERSPNIMDFFANPTAHDPFVFIKEFNGWLRAKDAFDDITDYEKHLLDTSGELFLKHLEKELHPTRSYKMVVLFCLLNTVAGQCEWDVRNLAIDFKRFYLDHPGYRHDYAELYNSEDPEGYSTKLVVKKLLDMPLKYLSNKETDYFVLEKTNGLFKLKEPVRPYWVQADYRQLIKDRVWFGIKRYFYKNAPKRSSN